LKGQTAYSVLLSNSTLTGVWFWKISNTGREVNPEFAEGLKDLEDFSHLLPLYHFSLVPGYS
jgi:hypothetical protein